MMSEELYNLEFEGKIIPGWEIDEVKANLAHLLKANEKKIARLFSGRRFFIKKNVDRPTAIKINDAFKDAGADCIMNPIPGSAPATPPPLPSQVQPDAAAQPPAATAKLPLAPADIHPTRFWYMIAVLLFLVPMIAGGVEVFNAFKSQLTGGTPLMVPGETDIQINKPGDYVIFYETSMFTLANAVNYQIGRDFAISVMDLSTGEDLALQPPLSSGTQDLGTTVRQPLAELHINSAGFYTATVEGEIAAGDRLIAQYSDLIEFGKSMLWALGLFFLGIIAGPIMALVIFVKHQIYKQKHRDEPISENEERRWAMFAHIGTFCSMFVPLGNFIAPIVIWKLKKHESDFVVGQAKESLNFQISLMVYALLCIPLCFIIIGFFLFFALIVFGLITVIVAGVRANDGEDYRYPMCVRLFN
jgi:uncharacterized Tic20 family protein